MERMYVSIKMIRRGTVELALAEQEERRKKEGENSLSGSIRMWTTIFEGIYTHIDRESHVDSDSFMTETLETHNTE